MQSVWTFYEKEGLVIIQILEVGNVGRKTHERRSGGWLCRRREALVPGGTNQGLQLPDLVNGDEVAPAPGVSLSFHSVATAWKNQEGPG